MEQLENLLYDFLHGQEHPWRTWAKAERQKLADQGHKYLPGMGHFLHAWRRRERDVFKP